MSRNEITCHRIFTAEFGGPVTAHADGDAGEDQVVLVHLAGIREILRNQHDEAFAVSLLHGPLF